MRRRAENIRLGQFGAQIMGPAIQAEIGQPIGGNALFQIGLIRALAKNGNMAINVIFLQKPRRLNQVAIAFFLHQSPGRDDLHRLFRVMRALDFIRYVKAVPHHQMMRGQARKSVEELVAGCLIEKNNIRRSVEPLGLTIMVDDIRLAAIGRRHIGVFGIMDEYRIRRFHDAAKLCRKTIGC